MQVSKLYSNYVNNFVLFIVVFGWTLNFHTCATNIANDTGIFLQQSGQSARAASWTGAVSEKFQDRTYTLVYQPVLSWENAWLACQKEGLTLARIGRVEQVGFLVKLANFSGSSKRGFAWIGGTRRGRGDNQYIWRETGTVVPSFIWAKGQPDRLNQNGQREDCVEVRSGYKGANDVRESGKRPFICTAPLVSPTPKPTPKPTTTTTTTKKPTTEEPTTTPTTTTPKIKTTEEPTTTPKVTTTTPKITTTTVPEPTSNPFPGFCTTAGFFPDAADCQKYHLCVPNAVGDLWDWIHTCPHDLVWCQRSSQCETNDVCPCSL